MKLQSATAKIITALILLAVIALGAYVLMQPKPATGVETPNTIVTCNKPYILVGTSCCLDVNDNAICDRDEDAQIPVAKAVAQAEDKPKTPLVIVNQSSLPADKVGQTALKLEYAGKSNAQSATSELNQIIQVGDSIQVKVIDPRYETPVALAQVFINNDASTMQKTDKYGLATLNITTSGNLTIIAYSDRYNKSPILTLNAYTSYTAGRRYSSKGLNADLDTNGKWTAWSYDKNGHTVIALRDNDSGKEIEFNDTTSTYTNPTISDVYLLFENTTKATTKVQAYHLYQKDVITLANKSAGNYAPTMAKGQVAVITSKNNDRKCLTDSQIELTDLYQSVPKVLSLEDHNQFALYWNENFIYYADLSTVQKCDYDAVKTIPIYKTNQYGDFNPVKIIEIKKPTYMKISALDYPYFANNNVISYITLNSKGGTSIRFFNLEGPDVSIIDDGSKVVERSIPQTNGNYAVWSEKSEDGKWHIKLYNLATRTAKWVTWNSKDQTKVKLEGTTIYYLESNQIYSVAIANE